MGKLFVLMLAVVAGVGCRDSELSHPVIRLQDVFDTAVVEGSPAPREALPRTEWRFDVPGEQDWKAGVGVDDLEVSDGRLAGRTTTDFPIIHVERGSSAVDGADLLHALELRLRVSAGNNLQVLLRPSGEPDFPALIDAAKRVPWALSTPLIPGDEVRTYTISVLGSAVGGAQDLTSAGIRRVLIRPSDSEGARFEIESIRLVFRTEYLATIPSGVSWQGFESVYKESLVTRAPETVSYEVTLPARPWLDLAVGTVEETPLTFRISVQQSERETRVLERTLTTAHRWEPASLDLTLFENESVTLRLALSSDVPGALGFWGAPVIRSRTVESVRSNEPPQAVIVFLADTLRRDHLDAYGYHRETAPTLARLAREGALFADAQAQAPWTKPSVASILTSLYPTSHGVKATADRMPANADTLAEAYRDAGYATLGIASNQFIGKGSNLHQGFEEFHESGMLGPARQSPTESARVTVDRFLPWLREHRDGPIFAYLHVTDPHSPFEPYRPYDTQWAQANGRTEHEGDLARLRESIKGFRGVGNTGQPTRQELEATGVDAARFVQHEKDWYDGSIRAMDVEFHRILEALEELGLGSKTLVAFLADHGEEFLEHDAHFHLNVYGENTNVPLVLWGPRWIPPGTAVSETVRSIDLMPTLLELTGLDTPEAVQGQSLVPLLSKDAAPSRWKARPAVTEFAQRHRAPPDRPGLESFAIVDGGWKLVLNELRPKDAPEWQLFDHMNDPLDQVDLSSQHPEILERLKALLEDWHRYAEAQRLPSDNEAIEGMSAEELERLRSLGYVQ